jgi:hypothetical protein
MPDRCRLRFDSLLSCQPDGRLRSALKSRVFGNFPGPRAESAKQDDLPGTDETDETNNPYCFAPSSEDTALIQC